MAKGSMDPTIFVGNWYIRPGDFMDAVGAERFPKRYRSDHRRVCANLVFFDSDLLSEQPYSSESPGTLQVESDASRGRRLSCSAPRKNRYTYIWSLLPSFIRTCHICSRWADIQEIKTRFRRCPITVMGNWEWVTGGGLITT